MVFLVLKKTWLPYEDVSLPAGFLYEFDMMVTDWRKYVPRVLSLGASRIVMHIDDCTMEDIEEMVYMIKDSGASLGISVSNNYDIERFVSVIRDVAGIYSKLFIQMMGIKHIGAQGQPFDERVLARIEYVAHECKHIEIQIDGSMNPETMVRVKKAGAVCVVVGSYLFSNGDIKKTLDRLTRNSR